MLVWLVGFIALAVFLSDRVCFGVVCDVARAGTGVGAVSWAVWAVSFGVGVRGVGRWGGSSGGDGDGGGKVVVGV